MKSKPFSLIVLSSLILFSLLTIFGFVLVKKKFWNVNVTAPSLTGICVGSGYQNLSDIVIAEASNTDFPANGGVLKLKVSGNFELDPSAGTVSVSGGGDLSNASIIVSNKNILILYDGDGTADASDQMTISGLKVRAITASGSGDIRINTGTTAIAGINPSTDLATFSSQDAPVLGLTSSDTDNKICAGSSITFTATSTPAATSFQFYKNGVPVVVPADGSLSMLGEAFTTTTLQNNDIITVTATTLAGCSTTSSAITTQVINLPSNTMISNDSNNKICTGQSITFTSIGTGNSFTFRRNNVTVASGASNTYTTTSVSNGDSFDVIATNTTTGCSNTSNAIVIQVDAPPTVGYTRGNILAEYDVTNTNGINLTNGFNTGGSVNSVIQPTNVGEYFGSGVNGIKFYPNAAGIGSHTITYTYTDPLTGCASTSAITIEVVDNAGSPITNLSASYCEDEINNNILSPNFSVFTNPTLFYSFSFYPTFTVYSGTFTRQAPLTYTITSAIPGVITGTQGSYKISVPSLPLNTSVPITIRVNYTCTAGDCGYFASPFQYTRVLYVTRYSKPVLSIGAIGSEICAASNGLGLSSFNNTTNLIQPSNTNYELSTDGFSFSAAPSDVIIPATDVLVPANLLGKTIGGNFISPTNSTNIWMRFNYTDPISNCSANSPSIQFRLNPIPNLPISLPSPTYCEGASVLVTPNINNNLTDVPFDANRGYFYLKKGGNIVKYFNYGATIINLGGLTPGNYDLYYSYYLPFPKYCVGDSDPVNFDILPTPAAVTTTGLNPTGYCSNNTSNALLTGKDGATTVAGNFFVRKTLGTGTGVGATNPTPWINLANNSSTLSFLPNNPSPANFGTPDPLSIYTYEIRFVYTNPSNCVGESIQTYTVNPIGNLTFSFPNGAQTCVNDASVLLNPIAATAGESFVANNGQFAIRRVSPSPMAFADLAPGVNTFSPATYGAGQYKIKYKYTTSNNCSNESLEQDFTINNTPQNGAGGIIVTNTCFTDNTAFSVDAPEPGLSYTWDFGDGFTSTSPIVTHQYTSLGTKNVSVTLTKPYGAIACSKILTTTIDIKPYPVANFISGGFCIGTVGNATQFTNTSTIVAPSVITAYNWDFGDGNTSSLPNPTHTYAAGGEYNVTLSVTSILPSGNPAGQTCTGSITKKVKIFTTKTPNAAVAYTENFNGANTGWLVGGTNTTWQQGVPAGSKINSGNASGGVWKTNLTGAYSDGEQGYVESPCISLNNLDRPVFSFKYWVDSENLYDGTAILYTVDDGVTWKTLGAVGQGLNWYNTNGLLSLPGGAIVGWSGNDQTEWKSGRFALDQVKNEAAGQNVRFRIQFASNPIVTGVPVAVGDGFAFDDVYVGNRQRIVLIEHFTNATSATARAEDNYLNTFSSLGVVESVNIQYHTGFPADDPMNLDNTADPSARALFYGISAVPKAMMDGNITQNTNFSAWGQAAYNLRTLVPTPFDIDINFITNPSDKININAVVKAREAFSGNLIVHTVVVEKDINGNVFPAFAGNTFKNVVKKFLPDAAGTRVNTNWSVGSQVVFNQSWKPERVYDSSKLGVVVFIQDDNTKEVYQASYAEPPVAPSITGTEQALTNSIELYPNPAGNQFFIKINDAKGKNYQYAILDNVGRMLEKGNLENNNATIKTDAYAEGMYLVRITASNGITGYKKIIVKR